MNQPDISHRPADADRVAAISRLVRRVCLLREQGDSLEAGNIESTRLAGAVRALRESAGGAAFTDADLERIYEAERKRAADANAICELLLPLLQTEPKPPPRVTAQARPAPQPTIPNRSASLEDGAPGISDMLDAMLAAERTGRRTSQTNRPTT